MIISWILADACDVIGQEMSRWGDSQGNTGLEVMLIISIAVRGDLSMVISRNVSMSDEELTESFVLLCLKNIYYAWGLRDGSQSRKGVRAFDCSTVMDGFV